jgi:alkanesulfonate monooxygenase SsuD/methylene tetrahydromethanopterin reductase-like flavin-dependent oxidoreductase (luciferase family)
MSSATRIEVKYPTRRALLASARNEGGALSLLVPVSNELPVGSQVLLEIKVERTELLFELEGTVRLLSRQGLGIFFIGHAKRAAAQMLATCAGRSADAGTQLDSRHDVEVRCRVSFGETKVKAWLKDASSTGAFIGDIELPGLRSGSELTIQIEPLFGLFGGRIVKARVIWLGAKHGVNGMGVRFLDATAEVRESLRRHYLTGTAR